MSERTPKGRRTTRPTNGAPAANGRAPKRAPKPVGPRRERYLVSSWSTGDDLIALLRGYPSCVVDRMIPSADPGFPAVAVVELDADRAAALALSGPMLHVEPDLPLVHAAFTATTGPTFADQGPASPAESVTIVVVGTDERPVADAEVYLFSGAFPVRGTTAPDGTVRLSLPTSDLRGLYVRPRGGYWSVWLARPELRSDAPNLVTCPTLPTAARDRWEPRALGLDAVPPTFRGDGVRIAVLDTGAAADHPDLVGRLTGDVDPDTLGHGTHAAGLIGGARGVAPEAALHVHRIFPDGRLSDLLEVLDQCVVDRVDLVNLSVATPHPSGLLAHKIEQARRAGTACVAAAGSDAGPVAFPASLPTVLAVAAVGRTGEFPPESSHATQVHGVPTADGLFSAAFTAHGPEIDVCAPGVAVVSSVPPDGYAGRDGTACAAPYVTGMAALLLAHHPDFRGPFQGRDAARVDRLFQILRASARPLHLGDPGRTGAGLPNVAVAFGVVPSSMLLDPGQAESDPLVPLRAALAAAGLLPT